MILQRLLLTVMEKKNDVQGGPRSFLVRPLPIDCDLSAGSRWFVARSSAVAGSRPRHMTEAYSVEHIQAATCSTAHISPISVPNLRCIQSRRRKTKSLSRNETCAASRKNVENGGLMT